MRCSVKLRSMKMKFVILFALITGLYFYVSAFLIQLLFETKSKINVVNMPTVLPYVVVHLDLKGTPLKLSYLRKLLPYLKGHGANGLLMEYEDMFPYEGNLVNLSAENCYKKTEVST